MRLLDTQPCEPRAVLNQAAEAVGPDPQKALQAVCGLRKDLEGVERMQVASALDQGWSWARIGRALGVSRQAVHHRYGGRRPDSPGRPASLQPSLSGRARLAVVIGRTEAAARRDALAGTEHVLAGLVQQGEGDAARLLERLGVTVASVREGLNVLTPSEISHTSPSTLPLSRRARCALQLAVGFASRHGSQGVSDLHLLRALVADSSAGAVHLLRALGVDRDDVIAALGQAQRTEATR